MSTVQMLWTMNSFLGQNIVLVFDANIWKLKAKTFVPRVYLLLDSERKEHVFKLPTNVYKHVKSQNPIAH